MTRTARIAAALLFAATGALAVIAPAGTASADVPQVVPHRKCC